MEKYKEIIMGYFNNNNKLLKKREVCEMMNVSIGKVDSMMKNGLPYIKDGRNVRFRLEDINHYLEEKLVVQL